MNINTKFMDKSEPRRRYPYAPVDWHEEEAEHPACDEGIGMVANHREVLRDPEMAIVVRHGQ